MLGSRRAISFWRQKRRLLSLERALTRVRDVGGRGAMTAPALATVQARSRLQAESKRKARFSED